MELKVKEPKQARSKTLVESIMIATARILPASGASKTTTNRIAELAGVSIGSLYQYFPNKNAIFAFLMEKIMSEEKKAIEDILSRCKDESHEKVVEEIIDFFVDHVLDRRELMAALYIHAPRLQKLANILNVRNQVSDLLLRFFETNKAVIKPKDLDLALFVMINSVTGVLQMVIFSPEGEFSREELKVELTNMIQRYLFKV